ncbi:hypothetical protein LRP52_44915 [Photobacterium sp. ZSDE20]|nr:hypothetical protein [Photobacterium sp. ZSDE20]
MDSSLKDRIKNQIFKFEANLTNSGKEDSVYTLDFESGRYIPNQLEDAGLST